MLKSIFWALVILFAIRFIVNFVVPVVRATRQMRRQVKDFQDNMNASQNAGNDYQEPAKPSARAKSGDYIDFEEVK